MTIVCSIHLLIWCYQSFRSFQDVELLTTEIKGKFEVILSKAGVIACVISVENVVQYLTNLARLQMANEMPTNVRALLINAFIRAFFPQFFYIVLTKMPLPRWICINNHFNGFGFAHGHQWWLCCSNVLGYEWFGPKQELPINKYACMHQLIKIQVEISYRTPF